MDGELEVGKRLLDTVWYRSVPAGPELHELTTDVRVASIARCRSAWARSNKAAG
jgi:hypothetical protein